MVERLGGNLITQFVQYEVQPGGNSEFYGATDVLKFDKGIRFRNSTLLPVADGIPEVRKSDESNSSSSTFQRITGYMYTCIFSYFLCFFIGNYHYGNITMYLV